MQGDKVSNETKEDDVARFGKELTSKIRLNDIKHPGTKFQQYFTYTPIPTVSLVDSGMWGKERVQVVEVTF